MTAVPLPLLLGEAPSPAGDPSRPLGGRIAVRLCNWLGWRYTDAYAALTDRFECLNVIERAKDADPWDRKAASVRWQTLLSERMADRSHPRVVVAFGRRAGQAIGAGDREFFEWRDGQLYDSVVVPHPSGRCRVWNDPATSVRVREVLQEALRRVEAAEGAKAAPRG